MIGFTKFVDKMMEMYPQREKNKDPSDIYKKYMDKVFEFVHKEYAPEISIKEFADMIRIEEGKTGFVNDFYITSQKRYFYKKNLMLIVTIAIHDSDYYKASFSIYVNALDKTDKLKEFTKGLFDEYKQEKLKPISKYEDVENQKQLYKKFISIK